MLTEKPVLIDSVEITETGGMVKNRFAKADGTLCGAGEKAHGVLNLDADENEIGSVMVYGISVVDTGNDVVSIPITAGDPVASDAEGKAVKADTASILNVNGFAVSNASVAGIGLAIKLV